MYTTKEEMEWNREHQQSYPHVKRLIRQDCLGREQAYYEVIHFGNDTPQEILEMRVVWKLGSLWAEWRDDPSTEFDPAATVRFLLLERVDFTCGKVLFD